MPSRDLGGTSAAPSSEPTLGAGRAAPDTPDTFARSSRPSRPSRWWPWTVLGTVAFITAMGRVWVIGRYPEPDGDAKGHLGIAAALLLDPFSVARHWVWPPGYHYFLAALLRVGLNAQGVRFLNCALAAVLPLLVWRYGESSVAPSASRLERLAPLLAGVLCAAMPVVNLLGTSAQPGTLFAVLVLVAVWSIDEGRFAAAGWTLAAAVMVRYEAAGALALLSALRLVGWCRPLVDRLPASLRRTCRLPPVVVVPGLGTVLGWLLAHRVADGTWLGFVREIYRVTHAQRATYFHQDVWTDFLFFPVVQPYYLFGLTIPLFLLGIGCGSIGAGGRKLRGCGSITHRLALHAG